MTARVLVPLLAGSLFAAPAAAAQTSSAPAPFPNVNGQVNALLVDGGTAYAGGRFGSLGPRPAPFAVVSATDGAFVRSWPGMVDWGRPPDTDGSILPAESESVEADGAGGWYVGGDFQRVDGSSIGALAHIRADGTVDPGFRAESDGVVEALVRHDGVLWAAGTFTRIGGRDITGLAALDPATGAALPRFPHGMDGSVESLSLDASAGRLYAAGGFSRAGRDAHPGVAAIDAAAGTVLDWRGALPDGTASRVSARDGVVYVTGKLHGKLEDMRIGAVALSAADGRRLPLDFGVYEGGEVLATPQAVVIGGEFTDGSAVHAFQPGTATRLPWFAGATRQPTALELSGDRLLLSGLGGGVAGYDARTGAPDGFTAAAGGAANDIAVGAGAIAVVGQSMAAGSVARRNVAAIDLGSGAVTALAPEPGGLLPGWPPVAGDVAALAKQGDVLFIGGSFVEAGGRPERSLAAIDVRTGAMLDLPDVEGRVEALAVSGSRLFVGGMLTKIGDVAVRNFGVVDLATGRAVASSPQFDGEVRALAVSAGLVHAGGDFYRVDGQARPRLASFDAATLAPAGAFAAQPDGRIDSIVADGSGGIWLAGDLRRIGAVGVGGVAHLLADGSVDADVPVADDEVYSVSIGDGQLYLGGEFDTVDGSAREGLASIRLADRALTAFHPHPDPGVLAVAAAPGGVLAGGWFHTTELTSASALARFGAAPAVAPPVAVGLPRVYGSTFPGGGQRFEGLEWDGAPTFIQTRWLRCDAGGGSCELVDDDADRVTVRAADAGHRFRVEAVAWNDGGASAPVRSAPGPLLEDHGPVPVEPVTPQLWGVPRAGSALTVDEGLFEPTPADYSYEWQRCDASGCEDSPGARDAPIYVVRDGDAGYRIRVLVRPGYAPDGAPRPASNELGPIVEGPAGPPPAAGAPVLSLAGDLLLASAPPGTVTYRFGWLRCDAAGDDCTEIAGTSRGRRLAGADAGHTLRAFTVAFDEGGHSTRGVSEPSAVIAGAPEDATPTPTPEPTPAPTAGPTSTPTPEATRSPTPSPDAGQGPAASLASSPDTTRAPAASLRAPTTSAGILPAGPRLGVRVLPGRASSRGVAVRLRSPDRRRVDVRLRFAGGAAVIGRATVALSPGVGRTIRIRLTRAALARLPRAVVASAGSVTSASVRLKRWTRRS